MGTSCHKHPVCQRLRFQHSRVASLMWPKPRKKTFSADVPVLGFNVFLVMDGATERGFVEGPTVFGCAPITGRLCYQTPHHSCHTRGSAQLLDKVYKALLQKSCFCWLTWLNSRLRWGQLLRKRLSLKKDWDVHSSGVCHENWADGSCTKALWLNLSRTMGKDCLLFLDAGFSDQPCSLSRTQLY